MDRDEILAAAREAKGYGYGTIVMQGGEDYGIKAEWMADIIRAMKQDVGLAITLSLGERRPDELKLWKEAGADRYLLGSKLPIRRCTGLSTRPFPAGSKTHPADTHVAGNRLRGRQWRHGRIPGQSWDSLADDIMLFSTLDLDTDRRRSYIPHPDTPMGAWMLEGRGEVALPETAGRRTGSRQCRNGIQGNRADSASVPGFEHTERPRSRRLIARAAGARA